VAIAIFFAPLIIAAQGRVAFTVADSIGDPVPYATVRIYQLPDTSKTVVLDVTDVDGHFSGELFGVAQYSLSLSSVGMEPVSRIFTLDKADATADLGAIVMGRSASLLNEVEVVAQRPLIKSEIDRLSYDIQADEDSKTKTIFDMLRKVPLVAVDAQENVLVKGSSSFKIYKNGRPNSAWSRNPRDVLKSIPASMIKRIEVITEPGAKYDAEGVNGILNIVTMENTMVKGAAGSVGAYAGMLGNAGGNAYLTAQLGKFTTTVNYGMNYNSNRSSRWINESEQVYGESGNRMMARSDGTNSGFVHYGNIEASYEIDTLNLVTFSFGGYSYGIKPDNVGHEAMTDAAGMLMYSYD
ncbi:MAG: TonB-dependent receptor, partial [Muribaculaceae bacterium]|nr:TonB-dependent receptor [Muribaculaceae bacterium]